MMIDSALAILLLPLLAFAVQIFLGKRLGRGGDWVVVGAMFAAWVLSGLVFLGAVRAGDPGLLTCEIEEGHLSTVLPLISNVAYRLGRDLRFDGPTERFVGDEEANALLTRPYRPPYVVPEKV